MDFIDLQTQYKKIEGRVNKRVLNVLRNGKYILGREVLELEEKLARYVGVSHCVSCGNGTDALELSLLALGIGHGDAIFLPSFTFFATGEAVSRVGAVPIFVDVDPITFNICTDSLRFHVERDFTEYQLKPKAIIAVDLFGLPASYNKIREIADEHELYLIEDGAQGFGGKLDGRMACSFGDISTTSFFPAKPLGGYGDGGAIFTDNDEYADLIRSLRQHGTGSNKYNNVRIGMNSRLDTLQAAILLEKLEIFNDEVVMRNNVALKYRSMLDKRIDTPSILDGYTSSWAQYTLKFKCKEERDEISSYLRSQEIPTAVYYSTPLHLQPVYKDCISFNSLCVSEELSKRCLSLPMHPYLTNNDLEKIIFTINSYYSA